MQATAPTAAAATAMYAPPFARVEDRKKRTSESENNDVNFQREGKRLLSLQHRLLLAKVLEDNRVLGRRRVESFKLGRSLEEVAHVFNTYCANINQASVDAGLDAWRGVDCAQFVRNVGLPQYDLTFERNLSGAKLQWLQMSQMAQLGVASFAHQKEVMKAVRPIDLHIAPNISPHMSRRRS